MKRGKDDGAAAVEFAFVLIPLLLVLCGMVEFGYVYFTQISLDHSVREGARAAALGESSGDVTSRVQSAATGVSVLPGDVVVDACGTDATVTVTHRHNWFTPLPGLVGMLPDAVWSLGDHIDLEAKGVAKC